jgi:hypothetical protein
VAQLHLPVAQQKFLRLRRARERVGQPQKNYSTQYSRVVPHHSTDCAITSLTSEIRRDPVLSGVYGRSYEYHSTSYPYVCVSSFHINSHDIYMSDKSNDGEETKGKKCKRKMKRLKGKGKGKEKRMTWVSIPKSPTPASLCQSVHTQPCHGRNVHKEQICGTRA